MPPSINPVSLEFSNTEITNGLCYYVPIYFGRKFLLKEYGIYTLNTTSGTAQIGIYADIFYDTSMERFDLLRTFRPGRRLHSASINPTANILHTTTLTTPLLLEKDKLYWGAFLKLSGTFGVWGPNRLLPIFNKFLAGTMLPTVAFNGSSFQASLPEYETDTGMNKQDRGEGFTFFLREVGQDGG